MDSEALLDHLREVTSSSPSTSAPASLRTSWSGTVPGAAAELLAAGINPNVGGFRLAPARRRSSCRSCAGSPGGSGCPRAPAAWSHRRRDGELRRVKCARDAPARDRRPRGAASAPPGSVALYASTEAHVVIRRAADMLGLGAGAVRAIAGGRRSRMRVDALEAADRGDVGAGSPVARGRHGGRRRPADRPAGRGRGRRGRSTGCGSTWTPPTAARGACGRSARRCWPASSAPTRSPSTRTSGSTRRSRAAACWCATSACSPLVPLRGLLRLARRGRPPGRRLRHARPAVQPQFRGAEGLGVAPRPRPRGLRAPDRPRHRARPYLGELVEEHPDFELMARRALDLLLPLPPAMAGEAARRSSTGSTSG